MRVRGGAMREGDTAVYNSETRSGSSGKSDARGSRTEREHNRHIFTTSTAVS